MKRVHQHVVVQDHATEDVAVLAKSPTITIATSVSVVMRKRKSASEVAREIAVTANVTSAIDRVHAKESATRRRRNVSRNSLKSRSKRSLSMVS